MARVTTGTYDPDAYAYYGTDGLLDALPTDHIFICTPPAGAKRIVIRVITRFKEEFTEIVDL